MGEGGRKLGQVDDRDQVSEDLKVDTKKSGTRRIPSPTVYSLGREQIYTDRPGPIDDEEDEDNTQVDIPRAGIISRSTFGIFAPSASEHEQIERQTEDIIDAVAARVYIHMGSEHPSAPRDEKLPTIVDPIVAKARLHEAGVEDDLPASIDSEQLPNVIDFRKKQQERVMGAVLKGGVDYGWEWWKSSNTLVRVWSQLNTVSVMPDWKLKKDIESLIDDEEELALCMRIYDGKIIFDKDQIQKALLKRFSMDEVKTRCTIERELSKSKKVTSK